MLEHLGHTEEAQLIRHAVDATTAAGILPPDLGGTAKTSEITASILALIVHPAAPNQSPDPSGAV